MCITYAYRSQSSDTTCNQFARTIQHRTNILISHSTRIVLRKTTRDFPRARVCRRLPTTSKKRAQTFRWKVCQTMSYSIIGPIIDLGKLGTVPPADRRNVFPPAADGKLWTAFHRRSAEGHCLEAPRDGGAPCPTSIGQHVLVALGEKGALGAST